MSVNCLNVIIIGLQIYHLGLVGAAPAAVADKTDSSDVAESTEQHIIHHHGHHATSIRRKRHITFNACHGRLAGPVRTLTCAIERKSVMRLLRETTVHSKDTLKSNDIDLSDFHEFSLHADMYNFLKRHYPNDEPRLSEWFHTLQLYEYTFMYLHEHEDRLAHRKYQQELEELQDTSRKVRCIVQSSALHLELEPNLKLITTEEKKTIRDRLQTSDQRHRHANEIDLMYAKKYFYDHIENMLASVDNCIKNGKCIGGDTCRYK